MSVQGKWGTCEGTEGKGGHVRVQRVKEDVAILRVRKNVILLRERRDMAIRRESVTWLY